MATQATINSDLIPKIVVGQRSSFAGTSPSLDGSQHLRTFYRRSSKVEHHAHNVYDAGSSPADGTGPACFETGVAVLHAVVGCFRWPVPRAAYNSQRKVSFWRDSVSRARCSLDAYLGGNGGRSRQRDGAHLPHFRKVGYRSVHHIALGERFADANTGCMCSRYTGCYASRHACHRSSRIV